MQGGNAVLLQGGQVSGCAIAFVVVKAVVRILFMKLEHEVVASDFGDDRSGGNGEAEGIAFDDGVLW